MQSNVSTLLKDDFFAVMAGRFAPLLEGQGRIAVAVSGGADSMALASLLSLWAQEKGFFVHVLSIDHGLRPEARDEARSVGAFFGGISHVTHKILTWEHEGIPASRFQERAREARYALMASEMRTQRIEHLFVGHHQDDQAETFLFRLAKGSGLDGLAGMAEIQDFSDGLKICRPLLGFPKQRLRAYCEENSIPFVDDPSNHQERFARIRLRNSMNVLEKEGLTVKRLARVSERLMRAREALEEMAEDAFQKSLLQKEGGRIVFDFNILKSMHKEIIFRVISDAFLIFRASQKYGVRMEKVEALCSDLMDASPFRKRTLGGVMFDRKDDKGLLVLTREQEKRKN